MTKNRPKLLQWLTTRKYVSTYGMGTLIFPKCNSCT